MGLARPSLRRVCLLALFVAALVGGQAAPALAHNGTGGAASDYRVDITGFQGDPTGVHLRVIELGNRVELTRTSASDVMVLGYEGEPYLHFDADGVFENVNSPAHYLNTNRFASVSPPPTASATATPSWTQLSSGASFSWHDHRAHWMSTIPPADVQADPDVERVVHTDTVALVIDGQPVSADIRVTWLPKPDKFIWLGVAALLVAAVAAAFVLVDGAQRFVPLASLGAAIFSWFGQGNSTTRLVLGGIAVVLAVLGLVLKRHLISVIAAVLASLLAATRLEVFEHELLAGVVSGPLQRVAIVLGLGLGLGVVASSVVGALSPTPEVRDADVDA